MDNVEGRATVTVARPLFVILFYQPLQLRGVEAGAGFLHAGQVAMAQHRVDGRKTAMELHDETLHRKLLLRRARVGDATRGREAALVADAYRMGIVAEGVSPHALHRAARMHHAIQRDVEVIADVSPAIHLHMVVAQLLHRISAIAATAAAMHHYHVYLSHISSPPPRLSVGSRHSQCPQKGGQHGNYEFEHFIPFLLVLFCHNRLF